MSFITADLMELYFCAPSDHTSSEEECAASVKNCSGETLRSNVTVGLPCHVLVRRRDRCDGVIKNKADSFELSVKL